MGRSFGSTHQGRSSPRQSVPTWRRAWPRFLRYWALLGSAPTARWKGSPSPPPFDRAHHPAETSEGGEPSPVFSIALSPQGHVHSTFRRDLTSRRLSRLIAKHFERGDGHGVFRLGAKIGDLRALTREGERAGEWWGIVPVQLRSKRADARSVARARRRRDRRARCPRDRGRQGAVAGAHGGGSGPRSRLRARWR